MTNSFCTHCQRLVPSKNIVVEKEYYSIAGKKETCAWVGCKDCYEQLQRVS